MAGLALASWRQGRGPGKDLVGILLFMVGSLVLGRATRRIKRLWLVELLRLVLGGVLAAVAFSLVSGPLAPWWPAFLLLILGTSIGFGLVTQRPFWGRVSVAFSVAVYVVLSLVPGPAIDGQRLVLHASVKKLNGTSPHSTNTG